MMNYYDFPYDPLYYQAMQQRRREQEQQRRWQQQQEAEARRQRLRKYELEQLRRRELIEQQQEEERQRRELLAMQRERAARRQQLGYYPSPLYRSRRYNSNPFLWDNRDHYYQDQDDDDDVEHYDALQHDIAEQTEPRHVPQKDEYQIVRGPDGNLYYRRVVPTAATTSSMRNNRLGPAPRQRRDNVGSSLSLKSTASPQGLATAHKHDDEHNDDDVSMHDAVTVEASNKLTTNHHPQSLSSVVATQADRNNTRRRGKRDKLGNSKKVVTVVVEDASDSENEDNDVQVWRNRRPSPGQWMEPVEAWQ